MNSAVIVDRSQKFLVQLVAALLATYKNDTTMSKLMHLVYCR